MTGCDRRCIGWHRVCVCTSWEACGGTLDEVSIAEGIRMAGKYDGIRLRYEYLYQTPDKAALEVKE